jgi:hypothetical protein
VPGFVASPAGAASSGFGVSFWSIVNALTSKLASLSSVDTISIPKQIWFKVDLSESQPLAMIHFIVSRRFKVPEAKLLVATKAMYPLVGFLYTLNLRPPKVTSWT